MNKKRFESEAYLDFVRSRKCFLCGDPKSEPHHHRKLAHDKGMALKPSDSYAVPVCRVCHDSLHAYKTKWTSNGQLVDVQDIDMFMEMLKCLTEYLARTQESAKEMYPKEGLVVRARVVDFVKEVGR